MSARRTVVITGMGCVSPLGGTAAASWAALAAGRGGVRPTTDAATAACLHGDWAELRRSVPVVAAARDVPRVAQARGSAAPTRVSGLAQAAALEALAEAGLAAHPEGLGPRAGVALGSGIGAFDEIAEAAVRQDRGDKLSPHFVPRSLISSAAGDLARAHGCRGPLLAPATACAAGAQAIADAARLIETGAADLMLAGGAEACLTPLVAAGFARMRALGSAAAPFDAARSGFVLGEGAAVLVLESAAHARARGVDPAACVAIAGSGLSCDAHHPTTPPPDGRGAADAMRAALLAAGASPSDVAYLNAHATSTPAGDAAEAAAIDAVFRHAGGALLVSSTKGATGHLLGAAGALEALFAARALEEGLAPPTVGLEDPCPWDANAWRHVLGSSRSFDGDVAVSNSFGFGGINTSLVLRRGAAAGAG